MRTLHVSAGGRGERIAAYIASVRPSLPKHLLPLPTEGRTILGEIALRAQHYFDRTVIWSSRENYAHIALALEDFSAVRVKVDKEMSGPMGPLVRSLLTTKHRVFGCAGDFYCDFSWKEFERFHEAQGLPVSILVANSIPVPRGARFLLDGGKIMGWERVAATVAEDKINIGAYIVDPVPEVIAGLRALEKHKEDPFFDMFIEKELISGYDPGVSGFNVNVGEVYEQLLHVLE